MRFFSLSSAIATFNFSINFTPPPFFNKSLFFFGSSHIIEECLRKNQDTERNLSYFMSTALVILFSLFSFFTGIWYISTIIRFLFHNPDHPLKESFCIFQHIFNKDSISAGSILNKYMSYRTNDFSILDNRASADLCVNILITFFSLFFGIFLKRTIRLWESIGFFHQHFLHFRLSENVSFCWN